MQRIEWNGYYLNIKQIYLIVAISAAVGGLICAIALFVGIRILELI